MTRKKKTRGGAGVTIFIDPPRRSEKLADPDSYESRKRKNLEQKKKRKSVYQKAVDAEQDKGQQQAERKTPLADKIRRLKAAENAREEADKEAGKEQSNDE